MSAFIMTKYGTFTRESIEHLVELVAAQNEANPDQVVSDFLISIREGADSSQIGLPDSIVSGD